MTKHDQLPSQIYEQLDGQLIDQLRELEVPHEEA